MARTKTKKTFNDLMNLAREYHVEDNALFIAAAEQYEIQCQVIKMIKEQLDADGSAVSSKEYVKGRVNDYANPLIKELPKHSDSASRTLLTMLDIINKLGHKTESKSALTAFNEEFE